MRLAIVGSRKLTEISLDEYVPKDVTEIVSGGAVGIDTLAREYANRKALKLTEFLPKYDLYGKAAPIKRNGDVAEYADEALAIWDGRSKGTATTIKLFQKLGKKVTVVEIRT